MKDIAVIYKYSAIESYSPKQMRRHRELNPELSHRMQSAHDDHAQALAQLQKLIDGLGLDALYFERDRLNQNLDGFRLVISLGGDGTFINASHFIDKTLLLGINSSPANSVGHYCRFELKTATGLKKLHRQVAALFEGTRPPIQEVKFLRMQVTGQGRTARFPVLNDALFCEENPAATSRYTLEYKTKKTHQKSSGLWVTTPTGSSAAFSSAGGKPFKQKELRFIVRELYAGKGRTGRQGRIVPGETLGIVSSMMHGALYLDGSHHKMPVALGEHISIGVHPLSLRAVY